MSKIKIAVLIGFLWGSVSFAADSVCVGSFEHASYGALVGSARYSVHCDDGRSHTLQKNFAFSRAAKERFFRNEVKPHISSMGLRLAYRSSSLSRFPYDVFVAGASPDVNSLAILSRTTVDSRGLLMEHLSLVDQQGYRASFPTERVASNMDFSNVDQLVLQLNYRRSQFIQIQSEIDLPILFVLYR